MQLVLDDMGAVLRHLTPEEAERANHRRRELLAALDGRARPGFAGTKPHLGPLSPGCERCGRGEWSCLFVSAICNAECFFCPTDMNVAHAPRYAERIAFATPAAYADYVAALGFTGASFSGGEPFLDVDALVAHVAALRRRLGRDVYLWAYTNGKAVTREMLARVADAGLDEVRFNIVATDYHLDAVRAAVGVVPRVTVEIPALPEDRERLREVLRELAEAGVDHLNLHQLMVVGENAQRLIGRGGYTFGRGPTPGVVESELVALELMVQAADEGLDLAINYCGLAFKGHFQSKVEDRRMASVALEPYEALTPSGLPRRLWVELAAVDADALVASWREAGRDPRRWRRDDETGRLLLHPELVAALPADAEVFAAWYKTVLGHAHGAEIGPIPDLVYRELPAGPERVVGARLVPLCAPVALSRDETLRLLRGDAPAALEPLELVPPGLPDSL